MFQTTFVNIIKDKCGQYWLCSKLRKKMLYAVNYRQLHVYILQGNTNYVFHKHAGLTETWTIWYTHLVEI